MNEFLIFILHPQIKDDLLNDVKAVFYTLLPFKISLDIAAKDRDCCVMRTRLISLLPTRCGPPRYALSMILFSCLGEFKNLKMSRHDPNP